MSNIVINDGFMNPNRFGYAAIPFKLNGNKNERDDVPQWRKNRTDARSMGSPKFLHHKPCGECGSLFKRVYDVSCFDCYKVSKEK